MNDKLFTTDATVATIHTLMPVLQGEFSNEFVFRVYNNFDLRPNVANALNVKLTVFDGAGLAEHTISKDPVSQRWIRLQQVGFGEGTTQPGLPTRFEFGEDVAVGGDANVLIPVKGSDGSNNPIIRAGNNLGFLTFKMYAQLPENATMTTWTFALVVEYDFI